MSDYPAAHSMDTTWFAVDASGRVATFDSGEDGAVPVKAASGGGAGEASFDLDKLTFPETKQLIEFQREHGDDPGLYSRGELPAQPVMVSDLPEEIRAHIGELSLPVDFTAQESVHLGDHLRDDEAMYWGAKWTLRGFGPETSEPPPHARVVETERTSRVVFVTIVVMAAAIIGWLLH